MPGECPLDHEFQQLVGDLWSPAPVLGHDVDAGEHGVLAVIVMTLRTHHAHPAAGLLVDGRERRSIVPLAAAGTHPPAVFGHRERLLKRGTERDQVLRGVLDSERAHERPIDLTGAADEKVGDRHAGHPIDA